MSQLTDSMIAAGYAQSQLAPIAAINLVAAMDCGGCGQCRHEAIPFWRGSRCRVLARCHGCQHEEEV